MSARAKAPKAVEAWLRYQAAKFQAWLWVRRFSKRVYAPYENHDPCRLWRDE